MKWVEPVREKDLPPIAALVRRLNARVRIRVDAGSPPRISRLRDVRRQFRARATRPAADLFNVPEPDSKRSWTFHAGGSQELQFNLGFVCIGGELRVRYGLGFSFETSQFVHHPGTALEPLIRPFNDHVQEHAPLFEDLLMWSERGGLRSPIGAVRGVRADERVVGTFVFMGRLEPVSHDDAQLDEMLALFDRLLPLYADVMRKGAAMGTAPVASTVAEGTGPSAKTATQRQQQAAVIDVRLLHNRMQAELHRRLAARYGAERVDFEQSVDSGGRFDNRVRHADGQVSYYEIKTAASAGACVRQAIGQLLEYAFWTGSCPIHRLVVVGHVPPRPDESAYIQRLNDRFALPLEYLAIEVPTCDEAPVSR